MPTALSALSQTRTLRDRSLTSRVAGFYPDRCEFDPHRSHHFVAGPLVKWHHACLISEHLRFEPSRAYHFSCKIGAEARIKYPQGARSAPCG